MIGLAFVALATPAASHEFDQSKQYYWVNPPDGAPQRLPPRGGKVTVPPGGPGSFFSADLQFLLGWPTEATTDDDAAVSVEPLDGSVLGALPRGYEPNGNAYRLRIEGL